MIGYYDKRGVSMITYEQLLKEADNKGLITKEKNLPVSKGRIKGNRIAIKRDMSTTEKGCVLAEELGHYYTTSGNILDQNIASNRKQEQLARLWSYNKLIGLRGIINAYDAGCTNKYEIAEFLNVTVEFLEEAIKKYTDKYGVCTMLDNYIIYFIPYLGVMETI